MSESSNVGGRLARHGVTVPLPGPLHSHADQLRALADVGYRDVWSSEVDSSDAFTPLTLAAVWEPRLRVGTAIVSAFTRGPACIVNSAAALASAAPGRFVLGIGASSNVVVERWNGVRFEQPYRRVRDVVRFVRQAMTGEKVVGTFDTFESNGFRLAMVPEVPPKLMVAGLREGMLRLAGRESDGAIINWLSADDVTRVARIVHDEGDGREIVARIFVCPSEDTDAVRAGARFAIAAYMNVPVYAEFHRWLGRGDAFAGMWDAWKAGDRKAALAAIPDEVVDQLVIHGSITECKAQIQRYFDNGVTASSLAVLSFVPFDLMDALRQLAPGPVAEHA